MPNDNVTALSVFRMSQLAKEDITVALTGSGGDELALGHNNTNFAMNTETFMQCLQTY